MDNDMPNFSLKKWEKLVDDFYKKYKGLCAWQKRYFKEVQRTGRLVSPITGRVWNFNKYPDKDGAYAYKWAQVCNYPVQGTAYDIIALWMCLCNKQLCSYPDVKLIIQVHDEIVYDCPTEYVDIVANTCYNIINRLDTSMESFFNCICNVPFTGEVKVGSTWGETEKYKFN